MLEEIFLTELDYTVLVIDDCSDDDTAKLAKKFKQAKIISLPCNLGVGGAVQTGLKFALANDFACAVKLDGDGQHPPDSLPLLIEELAKNSGDIIIGSRFLNNTEGFKSSFMRRIGIKFLQFFTRLLTRINITDPTSGFRAYNRRAIEFMAHHYPSFDYPEPEEIILSYKNGLKISEIPVRMRPRNFGNSTISSSISIYYMLKVSLSMMFIAIRKPENTNFNRKSQITEKNYNGNF